MAQVKIGDAVKVHYTGKLEDGTIFDTSTDGEPLQFEIGKGQVIPGFEQAIIDMKLGEEKTITIPWDKAYGAHHEELVMVFDRKEFPEHIKSEIGQRLKSRRADGQVIIFTVIDLSESSVTLDANHPLAGKDLLFEIKLLAIV